MFTLTVVAAVAAGVLHFAHMNAVLVFIVSALALATLASLVGRSVEALGDRLGPNATGILQTALGNLPELFVILFALKAGLYGVVKATLVGSILSNVLLVLGLAFVVGGIKHGRQRFAADDGRTLGLMFTLAVFILAVPSLTAATHTPAQPHERALSVVVSIVMLALFALSLPATLGNRASDPVVQVAQKPSRASSPIVASPDSAKAASAATAHGEWPLAMAIGVLAAAGIGAAFVSEWFIAALEPAMRAAGINEVFAGLVIVAIAGNAVEHAVGIVLAAKGQYDLAISVVKNSVAQIAAFLYPLLVLVSLLTATRLTFALAPVYIGALIGTAILIWQITGDGEATVFEGVALVATFVILATVASFE
jgi:Ca2+:H+ antiporter